MAPYPDRGTGWPPAPPELAFAPAVAIAGASSYSMWSIRWTLGGASRRNLSSAPCSAGRSLPESVSVLPTPCTLAREPNPCSEMASSMRPLYSAAFSLRTDSGFLAEDLSTCADLTSSTGGVTSAGFASEAAGSEFSVDDSAPGLLPESSCAGTGSVADGGETASFGDAEVLPRCWRTYSSWAWAPEREARFRCGEERAFDLDSRRGRRGNGRPRRCRHCALRVVLRDSWPWWR